RIELEAQGGEPGRHIDWRSLREAQPLNLGAGSALEDGAPLCTAYEEKNFPLVCLFEEPPGSRLSQPGLHLLELWVIPADQIQRELGGFELKRQIHIAGVPLRVGLSPGGFVARAEAAGADCPQHRVKPR